jgi:hypothetical protein
MDMLDYPMSVAEAKKIIKEGRQGPRPKKLSIAAVKLYDACRRETGEMTIDDAFGCVEYGGHVATLGARILYVLTARDGLGWNAGPFVGLRELEVLFGGVSP